MKCCMTVIQFITNCEFIVIYKLNLQMRQISQLCSNIAAHFTQ